MKTLSVNYLVVALFFVFSCESKAPERDVLEVEKPSQTEESVQVEEIILAEDEFIGELEQRLIDAGLVDVATVIPDIYVDLKYSTTDNFFGKDVYGDLIRCYVQPIVAEMLLKSHQKLKEEHPELTFLVYDGVRPQSVQQILWDNLDKPDSIKPLYVANPQVGGLHNFGVAVDLTLANQETGEALDMGTGYDFFGYPAYPDRESQMLKEGKITKEHISNREILRKVMKHGGFSGIGSEWWHFNAFSRKEAAEKFGMVK
ncbi:M15 family metallopeptidase [Belliella sp. DSM 107340]|uniref:D-alanyl-D-alanine dipeptidase n=1 Tax=Belliella calami TaxID=2923436 RepID=A0ABS9UN27_9BACT|nr:M15 family metallopeptidase [Belliella calami]MCH7397933.1 M15 family metallopeptidase [Belliella calami]